MSHAKSNAKDRDRAATRILLGIESGRKATDLFPEHLKSLVDTDRAKVVEGIYALLRGQARIDRAIATIAPNLRAREHARARWTAFVVLEGERSTPPTEIKGVDWSLLRGAWDSALEGVSDNNERLGIEHSLPAWLVERILAEEPDGIALIRALAEQPPFTVRANRSKSTRESLAERLEKVGISSRPTTYASDGLHLDHHRDVYGLPAFQHGDFEIQDEGSQLIGELVAPPPGGLVVDACAGAGEKTLHIGALLAGSGRVVAMDVPAASHRLSALRRRIQRARVENVQVVTVEPKGDWPPAIAALEGKVDRLLIDAPCSGTGVYRRDPEHRLASQPQKVTYLAGLQRQIVERALPMLRLKGRLIYATCSVLRAENDEVVQGILADHPELELVLAKEILGRARAESIGDGSVLRVRPHTHGTDGFYAAVLRRRA